jgi:hypothetical protein
MPYRITLADPHSCIIALHRVTADHILAQHPSATSTYISFSSAEWAALKQQRASPLHVALKKDIPRHPTGINEARREQARQERAGKRASNGIRDQEVGDEGEIGKGQKKGAWAAVKRAWRETQSGRRAGRTNTAGAAAPDFGVAWAISTTARPGPGIQDEGSDSASTADLLSGAGELEDPFGEAYEVCCRESESQDERLLRHSQQRDCSEERAAKWLDG